MEDEINLIPNERPQRIKDKVVKWIRKLFKKESDSNLNQDNISEGKSN